MPIETKNISHWHHRFLSLAAFVAQWSKDPSTKVGAVITDPLNRVISLGFNGFPRGFQDTQDRLLNRDLKNACILHAERNAILFAQRSLDDCILYTWPMAPCPACASMVVQSGIQSVYTLHDPRRYNCRYDPTLRDEIFFEGGVSLFLVPPEVLE